MTYVDAIISPVRRDRLEEYIELARGWTAIWRDHGALSTLEYAGDDVPEGKLTSFPLAVQANEDEVVCISLITYRDRAHRDEVSGKAMKDPRFQMPEDAPMDGKRMIFGGFRMVLRDGAA